MKSKVVMFAAALAFAASGAAFATKPGNNGGGNGGCGQGQQTNGCGGSSGGAGGAGGTGVGVGVGVGIGQGGNASATGGRGGEGGSVIGSGNSSNANSNKQAQGQQQGQAQSSRNRNDNRSSANTSNDQSVTVQGDNYDAPRIPVATAYAPNIAPTAVCMGSSSAGAQGVTFGVSFGSSWTDDNCMLLEQVRTVASVIGDREIAAEMMCEVKAYKEARARAGKPCGSAQPVAAIAPQTMGDNHQPKYGPVAAANVPVVVSPVPPSVERFRVTLDGLQAVR